MTRHIYRAAALAAGLATIAVTGGPAAAHPRHRRPTAAASAPAAPPYSFYPESIEGGVKGNLPFNNQLRKLSDPLNANGGR